MDKYRILTLIFAVVTKSDASRILAILPTPSISHQIVFRPLLNELVKRGHEVVVITPDPAFPPGEAPENFTEIDVHNESYHIWRKSFKLGEVRTQNDNIKQFEVIIKAFLDVFESQLQNKLVKDLIENKHNNSFDLLFVETCMRPAIAFSHVYKAPVISISSLSPSFEVYAIMGVPNHPFLYPVIPQTRLYNLTCWEKIKELYHRYYTEYVYNTFRTDELRLLKKYFGSDLPTYDVLYDNIHMYFQNVNSYFMDNIPVPPSVVYMGGLHLKPTELLPKDLELFLNNSKNGVVYVSFGTNVKTSQLPPEKVQMMLNVFSKLPFDILWKMDKNELPGKIDNIKVSKWLPQADLLRHPNVRAFVTQAGLQSTDEAIIAGVPLVGIPFIVDQWINSEKYVKHKIGLQLNWDTLNEEDLRKAIITVTEDSSYRDNIRKFRVIINDQPQTSLERAIWWVEYVLRHGGARHLRAPAANISWTEYYEIKLILILITVSIAILVSLLLVLSFIKVWLKSGISNILTRINKIKLS